VLAGRYSGCSVVAGTIGHRVLEGVGKDSQERGARGEVDEPAMSKLTIPPDFQHKLNACVWGASVVTCPGKLGPAET
jgi:hypothetical protein